MGLKMSKNSKQRCKIHYIAHPDGEIYINNLDEPLINPSMNSSEQRSNRLLFTSKCLILICILIIMGNVCWSIYNFFSSKAYNSSAIIRASDEFDHFMVENSTIKQDENHILNEEISEELIQKLRKFQAPFDKKYCLLLHNKTSTILDLRNLQLADLFELFPRSDQKIPESKDWRNEGIITSVKDQKACGSCWAFAAAALAESLHAKTGKLINLSEQELIECIYPNNCSGNSLNNALTYINKCGMVDEKSNEYRADEKNVSTIKNCRPFNNTLRYRIDLFGTLSGGEEDMKEWLAFHGPLIAQFTPGDLFVKYKPDIARGKIFGNRSCGYRESHAVLVVGYGEEEGVPYWIIKNSWGETWGDRGFGKIRRGSNTCGFEQTKVIGGVLIKNGHVY